MCSISQLHGCLFMLVYAAVHIRVTTPYPWEECNIVPVAGCSCWDPDRPSVSCAGLNLTYLPHTFNNANVGVLVIHTLDLSDNKLQEIRNGAFKNVNVNQLVISNNKEGRLHIDDHAFIGAPSNTLVILILRNCDLELVPTAIQDLNGLELLDLSNNNIVSLTNADFGIFENIRYVQLENNPIRMITLKHLPNVQGIEALSISLNNSLGLRILDLATHMGHLWDIYGSFRWSDLIYLKVNNSHLGNINRDDFWVLPKLTYLELTFCEIGNEDLGIFFLYEIRKTLKHLSLAHNKIKDISSINFYQIPNVEVLDLSYNKIRIVSYYDLRLLRNLRVLNMESNTIERIEYKSFAHNIHLSSLLLSNNRLESLRKHDAFENLTELSLAGNPWKCSCDIWWIIQMAGDKVYKHTPSPLSLPEVTHTLTCTHQDLHTEKPIIYYYDKLICKT